MYIRWLKKLIASLQIFLLVFTPQLIFPLAAYAAISGTFTATQTVANLSAVNDQSATTATTVVNVTAGAANDQTAATATTQANAVAVAQINTITVSGTVETGDVYTATLPTVGAVNYTVTGVDATTDNIATGLNNAIQASAGYATQDFTSGVSASVITLTAKVVGTGFTVTSSATQGGATNDQAATSATTQANVVAVAQVNTITVGGTVETGDVYTATLPTVGAVNYTVTGGDATTDNIATGLNNAILASSGYAGQAFTSSVATNVITLTAKVAGTGFTQTSGAINRVAVAQVNTITIGGTVESGDIVTATVPTDGAINYTVAGGDTTTANIATGLNTAIQASTNYATQGFTSAVSGSVVTLTAKVAGTGFTQTSGTTNRTPVAQVVTFTPASVTTGETFRGTVNGTNYDYLVASGNTVATVVAALATSMDADGAVACVDTTSTTVTCTASVAGTAFTFAATVIDITAPSAFTAGAVVTTGGTVVASKWNATNTGVDVTVPIANDPTLTGGTIQLQAEADGTFENLGAAYTILVGNLGGNVTLSRTDVELEALTGFSNGDNVTFRAITTDSNTNTTTGSVSATSLDVDQATPTFIASRTAAGTITLTFNENVSASDTSITAWTVSGATVTAASQPANATTLTLTVTGLTGTSETPAVAYVAANGTVLDAAGNEVANGANTTATDGLAPTLAEITPITALTNDTTPDYTFSSTEAGTITYAGGCSSGNTSASAGSNTKTFTTLSDGTYGSCTIRVTDSASNQSSALSVSSFTVDATAPNVPSITSVASDNRVNASEKSAIVVAGSAEVDSFVTVSLSDGTNTVSVTQQLTGGGTSYSVTLSGNSATPATLADGNLSVNVTARDAANNTSSAGTASVPLDTAAPVFSSVAPATNAFINSATTSSDILYNLDSTIASGSLVITRTSGIADASSPHTCSLVGTALNAGAHTLDLSDTTNGCSVAQTLIDGAVYTFVFNGADSAGNNATTITTTNVTFDTTLPAGTFAINNGAAYTNNISVTINFSSVSSDVALVEFSNGTSGAFQTPVSFTNPYSYTLPNSINEIKTVRARFTDSAGNVSSSTSDTITFDNVVPTISSVLIGNVTTANNSYVKNSDSVSFTATITDANQADLTTSMITANLSSLGGGSLVNPTSYNISTGAAAWTNLTVSGLTNGSVSITVNASDAAANAAVQGSDSITADNTAPSGSITAPANNSFYRANPIFTASASDTNGVASVKFQYKANVDSVYTDLNTDASSPYAGNWGSVTLTNATFYNLQIIATDSVGNAATVGGTSFTFDTTAPVVSITAPLSGATTGSSPTLTATTNESTTCSYVLDSTTSGTMGTTGSTSHSHALSGLAASNHTLQLACTDLAGNSTTSSSRAFSSLESTGSTINASSTSPTLTSSTSGQADLPLGITSVTLGANTNLNLTSSVNTASGGNITVGGASLSLANFTSGSLTGINLSTAKTIGDQNIIVSQAVKLESGTNGEPVVISNSSVSGATYSIPDGTTILGSATWGGTLTPPKPGSGAGSAPSGFQIGGTVFEVGSANEILLFDNPVSVVLTGVNGPVAYKSVGSNSWVQISGCGGTYAAPASPAFPGECSISNGTDTKIYTYHFTSFTALEYPAGSTNSGTPVCTDTKPASAPTLLSARSESLNTVTLTWSKATDPVTYYLVAYGNKTGEVKYGNPDVGGRDTTSYTVKGLSGGTYYFRVRAGNSCMPGDYSNELAVNVGGEELSGTATGFTEGVLGEEVEEGVNVKGAEDQAGTAAAVSKITKSLFDNKLLLGLVVLVAGGSFYYLFRRK